MSNIHKHRDQYRLESAGYSEKVAAEISDRLHHAEDPAIVFAANNTNQAMILYNLAEQYAVNKMVYDTNWTLAQCSINGVNFLDKIERVEIRQGMSFGLKNMKEIDSYVIGNPLYSAENAVKVKWEKPAPATAFDYTRMFAEKNVPNLQSFEFKTPYSAYNDMDAVKEFFGSVPKNVQHLNLTNVPIDEKCAQAFVGQDRKIKSLGLRNTDISDEVANVLGANLKRMGIENLDLSGSILSEKARAVLVDEMPEGANVLVPDNSEIKTLNGELFKAARNGTMADIYAAKIPVAPKDYLTVCNGRTLIEELAQTKQLAVVFQPKNWLSPKDMQTVWDAVPDAYKKQMDGKDGRPSYIKVKNQVMMAAVKSATKGGR